MEKKHGESWHEEYKQIQGVLNVTILLGYNFLVNKIVELNRAIEIAICIRLLRCFHPKAERFPHCCALNSRYRLFTYESSMHARDRPLCFT